MYLTGPEFSADGRVDHDIAFAGNHHHGVAETDGPIDHFVNPGRLLLVGSRAEGVVGDRLLSGESTGEQKRSQAGPEVGRRYGSPYYRPR